MQSATEKTPVFTPEAIARKIGGDTSDVLAVMKVCFVKGTDAAFQWMKHGDYSKPWEFSDSDKRGDALLDIHTAQLCADLHEVTVRPDDHGPVSKDAELLILQKMLLKGKPFYSCQFDREEIARWLVAFGLRSEYEFSQGAKPPAGAAATEIDRTKLATRGALINAFGSLTGMDESWFDNLKDAPKLMAARKVTGQGGRGHITEPWFCPYEVMLWLSDSKRKKGRKLTASKAWGLLEKHFPNVYNARSIGDPRTPD